MTARTLGLVVVVAYAWWATSLRPFTSAVLAATLVGGLAAIAVGARLSRRTTAGGVVPGERPGAVVWWMLLAALGAWELAAYLQLPRADHPTLSSLANALLDNHGIRALAMVVWLALGTRIRSR